MHCFNNFFFSNKSALCSLCRRIACFVAHFPRQVFIQCYVLWPFQPCNVCSLPAIQFCSFHVAILKGLQAVL